MEVTVNTTCGNLRASPFGRTKTSSSDPAQGWNFGWSIHGEDPPTADASRWGRTKLCLRNKTPHFPSFMPLKGLLLWEGRVVNSADAGKVEGKGNCRSNGDRLHGSCPHSLPFYLLLWGRRFHIPILQASQPQSLDHRAFLDPCSPHILRCPDSLSSFPFPGLFLVLAHAWRIRGE